MSQFGEETILARISRGSEQYGESELRVTQSSYNGRPFLGLRIWEKDKQSGEFKPTKKGVSVRIKEIGEVVRALQTAAGDAARGSTMPPRPEASERQRSMAEMQPPRSYPSSPPYDENDDIPF